MNARRVFFWLGLGWLAVAAIELALIVRHLALREWPDWSSPVLLAVFAVGGVAFLVRRRRL